MRVLAFILIALSTGLVEADGESSMPKTVRPLVGVSYFAGWWEPLPNKWHDEHGQDWRPRFPERLPSLGQYNAQEVMDREIVAAAEHGVDFFAILWYYQPDGMEREPQSRHLDQGMDHFMASPESHRMKFMIEFCNHPPYLVKTDAEWEACLQKWIAWMRHPAYLRVDHRPVFKVHGFHHFMAQLDAPETEAPARLNRLRDAVRDAGLGELMLGCGVGAHESIPKSHPATDLFDFTGTYMDLPQLEQREEDYPYDRLLDFAREGAKLHSSDAMPWMPYLPAGWAPRPWPDPRAYFALPNRDEWRRALEFMRDALREHAALGLPAQPAFTIYAWNEFGEGGIVAPTQGDGYMKLETIRDVFGMPEKIAPGIASEHQNGAACNTPKP